MGRLTGLEPATTRTTTGGSTTELQPPYGEKTQSLHKSIHAEWQGKSLKRGYPDCPERRVENALCSARIGGQICRSRICVKEGRGEDIVKA